MKDKTLTDAEWLSSHSTLHKSRIKAIYKRCKISRNNVMIWNKQVCFLQASNTSQSEPFSTDPKLQHLIIHDFNQINIPKGVWSYSSKFIFLFLHMLQQLKISTCLINVTEPLWSQSWWHWRTRFPQVPFQVFPAMMRIIKVNALVRARLHVKRSSLRTGSL